MMAQFTVSGIVYDGDKEPAIGATVVEKGKASNGTVTDMEGRYNLKVSSSKAVLVVTYIGFDPQEVAVNGKGKVNVFLQETPTNLDEVVIVGFATQKKINATGAVKTIDDAALKARPTANAVQSLQGVVAGLNITNDAGGSSVVPFSSCP